MKTTRKILLGLLLMISAPVIAQNSFNGYLGKRLGVAVDVGLNPGMTFGASGNTKALPTFRRSLSADFSIDRRWAIGVSVESIRTRHRLSYDPFRFSGEETFGTVTISGVRLGVDFRHYFMKGGGIAPLGTYLAFGIGQIFHSGEFEEDQEMPGNIESFEIYESGRAVQVYLGLGKQRALTNSLFLKWGGRIGMVTQGSFVELPNPNANQFNAETKPTSWLRATYLYEVSLGLGYLIW